MGLGMRIGERLVPLGAALLVILTLGCTSGESAVELSPTPTWTPPSIQTPTPSPIATKAPTPTPSPVFRSTPTPTPTGSGPLGPGVGTTTLVPELAKTYTHTDLEFSFSYPEGWRLTVLSSQTVLVGRDAVGMSITADILGEGTDLESYDQAAMERGSADLSGVEVLSSFKTALGSLEAIGTRMTYLDSEDQHERRGQLLTLQSGKLGFAIFFSAPEGEIEGVLSTFGRIVESLQLPRASSNPPPPRVTSTAIVTSLYDSAGRLSRGSGVFEPSLESLFAVVQAQYLPMGSFLRFNWLGVDADSQVTEVVSAGAILVSSGSGLWSTGIRPEGPMALGQYLLAILADDRLLVVKPFIIVEKIGSEFQGAGAYQQWGGILTAYDDQETAIYAYSKAIELDPTSAVAYEGRAFAFVALRRDREAVEDAEKLVELRPVEAESYGSRALVLWMVGESDAALLDLDRALELGGPAADYYNHRSLVHATLGSTDEAIADANSALALSVDNAHILDTRGYAYLKARDYGSARADYEELLRREFTVPHVLLGAGIAYAELGDSAKALPLLEDGLNDASLERRPDPELADLMSIAKAAIRQLLSTVSG